MGSLTWAFSLRSLAAGLLLCFVFSNAQEALPVVNAVFEYPHSDPTNGGAAGAHAAGMSAFKKRAASIRARVEKDAQTLADFARIAEGHFNTIAEVAGK